MSEHKLPLVRKPEWVAKRKKLLKERKISAGNIGHCYRQREKRRFSEAGKK